MSTRIETKPREAVNAAVKEGPPCPFPERELTVLQRRIEGKTQPQIVESLGDIGLEGVKYRFAKIAPKTEQFMREQRLSTAGDSADFNYLAIVIGVWQEWLDVSHLPEEPTKHFTPREKEIVELMAAGFRWTAIENELSISYWTRRKHTANIMKKLGVRSHFQVVAWGAWAVKTNRLVIADPIMDLG